MRSDWLQSGTGIALLREESCQVAAAFESIFGDQFLQIGAWGEGQLFRQFARTRRYAVVAARPAPGVDLISAPEQLAIAPDSIDAVFLPHTLETAEDPHDVLREVDRILRPDGHLVVLGFNPWGWWGLRHYLSRRRFPAGGHRMISEFRLHDWLRLLSGPSGPPRKAARVKRDIDELERAGLIEVQEIPHPGHGRKKEVRAVADQVLLAI